MSGRFLEIAHFVCGQQPAVVYLKGRYRLRYLGDTSQVRQARKITDSELAFFCMGARKNYYGFSHHTGPKDPAC